MGGWTLEKTIELSKRLELADRIERDLKSGAHMFSLHGAEMDRVIECLRGWANYPDIEFMR